VRRIHLVGIGGTGMCGIAEVLLSLGFTVTGTDRARTPVTDRLLELGARIDYEHTSPLVLDADVAVISSAISSDNPELRLARAHGVQIIRRAEMLAELMRMKQGIAIGGSHGKTSVTSMVAEVLTAGGMDPTVVVGGRVHRLGSNARIGRGDYLVAEADESDGSFLHLQPAFAVITNIDWEHVDHYPTLDEVLAAFVHFANGVPFYGAVIVCLDDPNVQAVLPRISRRVLTYGLQPGADLIAREIRVDAGGSSFELVWNRDSLGRCAIQVPGRHNVANALAAAVTGLELGIPAAEVMTGLQHFSGVGRRLERRGASRGVIVYDDYAHHPREIEASLAALREAWRGRLTAVFQPHRYSRARALAADFGRAFYAADRVIIAPIYPAGEEPISGVDAAMLARECRAHGHKDVRVADSLDGIAGELHSLLAAEELVVTLGAGSVWRVGAVLLERLRADAQDDPPPPPVPIAESAAAISSPTPPEPPHSGTASAEQPQRYSAHTLQRLTTDLHGELHIGHPMERCTTLKLGGPADALFVPAAVADLAHLTQRCREEGIPLSLIGGGSNLLVADAGIPGVAISLGRGFASLRIDTSSGHVVAGAALPLARLMRETLRAGLCGLEGLAGIPGSVGGAVVMNAGTRAGEIGTRVVAVHVLDGDGNQVRIEQEELGFAYRTSRVEQQGWTLVEVEFRLEAGDIDAARAQATDLRAYRNRTQPHRVRSAGSIFKNPPGDAAGRLLDQAGLKGTRVGAAEVSTLHANYLIATRDCTAADLVALIACCRRRVWATAAISLELEVKTLGFASGEVPAEWREA
jgi:UDP-N-acetylmuramate--alanine ligase